jgi:hypothetical protein
MMEVTTADAYREACLALGEAIVAQRLLQQHINALEAAQVQDEDQS